MEDPFLDEDDQELLEAVEALESEVIGEAVVEEEHCDDLAPRLSSQLSITLSQEGKTDKNTNSSPTASHDEKEDEDKGVGKQEAMEVVDEGSKKETKPTEEEMISAPSRPSTHLFTLKQRQGHPFPKKNLRQPLLDFDRPLKKPKLWSTKPVPQRSEQVQCISMREITPPVVYVEGLSKAQAMREFKEVNVNFVDSLDHGPTHYVFGYNKQVGVFKTANLYIALARKLWAVSPDYVKACTSKHWTPPPWPLDITPLDGGTDNYTLDCYSKVGAVGKHRGKTIYDVKKLFDGLCFVFCQDLRLDYFIMNRTELMELIEAAGGVVRVLDELDIGKVNESEGKTVTSTFVLTTGIVQATQMLKCQNVYAARNWKTVHPQYVLDCIWMLEVLEVPANLLFIPEMMLQTNE